MIIKPGVTLVLIFFVFANVLSGQTHLDAILDLKTQELEKLAQRTSAPDSLSRIKYALAKKYLKRDIQRSLSLFSDALLLVKRTDDKGFEIQIKKSKALAHINLQEKEEAIPLLEEASIYYKRVGEPAKYASTLGFYSYLYTEMNEYAMALKYGFQALEIFKRIEDSREIQNLNNRIGIIYEKTGENMKALEYYEKNIALSKSNPTKGLYRASINNAGGLYMKIGDLEKAESYLREAFELRKLEDNPKTLAYAYENLANLELIKGNKGAAIRYLDSAYLNFRKVDYRNGAAGALSQRTLLLKEVGKTSEYKQAVLEVLSLLKKWDIKSNEEVILAAYSDILFEEGRTREAYANLKESIQLYKDKYSENKFAEIEELENQLKQEQEESRIQELSREIEVRNIQQKYMFIVLGLGSALIMLLLYTNRDRKKKNKAIGKSLQERDILIKEIHHRVKNNLQIVSSILSLQSRNIQDKETKEAIIDSRDRVKSMALIHQKLYQENNLKGVEMKGYLENLSSSLSHSYGISENVEICVDVPQLILDIDTTIPIGLITNELIINAFKHAFKEGKRGQIWVTLKEITEDSLLLQVKDDGDYIKDLKEFHEGFGFQLIRSLSRKLKASPKVELEDGLKVSMEIKNYKKVKL